MQQLHLDEGVYSAETQLVQMFDLKEAEAYEKGEDKALASALSLGSLIMLQRKCLHMEESRKYGAAYLPLERDVSL